jgi:hypothetical protein
MECRSDPWGGLPLGGVAFIKVSTGNIKSAIAAAGIMAIANTIKTTPKYLLEMTVLFISITSYPVRKTLHLRRGCRKKCSFLII